MPNALRKVAGYLEPQDLLNMARSARSLRNLLMSKDSKRIWRISREASEIPDCPEDLSEPQYADLLFGIGCYVRIVPMHISFLLMIIFQYCGRARAHSLFFSLRIRLCGTCAKEQ